jgi:hypothetical protein
MLILKYPAQVVNPPALEALYIKEFTAIPNEG